MRLLDANVDVHLAPILKQQRIARETVAQRGWKALSNDDLVAVAYAEAVRCLLTRDQLFGKSASHALKSFAEFAVVVITLSQQRWSEYQ
jgi:predicted nuclease of predicted toxin-antitoxin system